MIKHHKEASLATGSTDATIVNAKRIVFGSMLANPFLM
jgi:hypothetical protein